MYIAGHWVERIHYSPTNRMTTPKPAHETDSYPVVPLRDVVVFPSMIFPLLIGRAGTLAAVERAMIRERKLILLAQKDANQEELEPTDLYSVGVIANVLQTLKLPNGLVKVLIEGVERARAVSFTKEDGSLIATVQPLTMTSMDHMDTRAHTKVALRRFRDYVNLNRQLPDEILITLTNLNEPDRIADFMMAHLPLSIQKKQEVLDQTDLIEQFKVIIKALDE